MRDLLRYIFGPLAMIALAQDVKSQTLPKNVSSLGWASHERVSFANGLGNDTMPLSQDQQNAINYILNKRAQGKFLALSQQAASVDYAREVATIENDVNGSLEYFPDAKCTKVVVLNHERFVTGVALGLEPKQVLDMLLQEKGVDVSPVAAAEMLRNMTRLHDNPDGSRTLTTEPALLMGRNRVGVLILPSDYAPLISIEGLTPKQAREFIKHHEIAHAFDERYSLSIYDPAIVQNINWNKPATIADVKSGYEIASLQCMRESWGDVVAAVMMLRLDPTITDANDFLDKIIKSRLNESPEHMSAGVLEGLKDEIAELGGLKKLRKMDVFDVINLCQYVNDQYGMTKTAVNAAMVVLYGDEAEVARVKRGAAENWEIQKGVVFAQRLMDQKDVAPTPVVYSAETLKAVNAFQAQDTLVSRAMQDSSALSGETIVKAYGALMNDLRAEAKIQPDAAYLKMNKLTLAYTGMRDMNLTQLNQDHNVGLLKVLPEAKGATSAAAVFQAVIH